VRAASEVRCRGLNATCANSGGELPEDLPYMDMQKGRCVVDASMLDEGRPFSMLPQGI
jgi:hypothetical protein